MGLNFGESDWYDRLQEAGIPLIFSLIVEAEKLEKMKTLQPPYIDPATSREKMSTLLRDIRNQLHLMRFWQGGAMKNEIDLIVTQFDLHSDLIIDVVLGKGG